jgi:hypothetical protein
VIGLLFERIIHGTHGELGLRRRGVPIGLLYDVRGLVGDEARVRRGLAVTEEDVAPVGEGTRGEGSGRGMSRRIVMYADIAQVGAECRLDLASNIGGQRNPGGLPLNGFGCHRAGVQCGGLRRSNRQIHRQRALSDGAGAGAATHSTYRPHVSLAPLGSIPTHAITVPPAPGAYHKSGAPVAQRREPATASSGKQCCRRFPVARSSSAIAIDQAFKRRFSDDVFFRFPSPDMRAELWRRTLPEHARTATIDFDALAERYEPSGGFINVACEHAAYVAGAGGTEIDDELLRSPSSACTASAASCRPSARSSSHQRDQPAWINSGFGLAPKPAASRPRAAAAYRHSASGGGASGGGEPSMRCGPAVPVLTLVPMNVAVPPGS